MEVEDEDEADGPSSGRREEVAHDTGGERPVSEQGEVHHRRRHHPFDRHEGDEARDAREEHDEIDRRPAGNRAQRDPEEREGQAAREEKISCRIEFLAARTGPEFLEPGVRPDRGEHADGHVDPENRLPTQIRGEDAPGDEADQGAAGPRHLVQPEGPPALGDRKRIRQDGGAVREEEARPDSLDEPEQYEALAVRGEAAKPRADCEDREADVVQTDAAVQVRQPADRQQEARRHQHVAQDDPDAFERRRAWEVADDRRKGNQDDVRVEQRHERPDGRVRQHDVLVLHSVARGRRLDRRVFI